MNSIIRVKALEYGVRLWQIAERLGVSDFTFSRRLRKELPEEEKERVLRLIDEIAAERAAGGEQNG